MKYLVLLIMLGLIHSWNSVLWNIFNIWGSLKILLVVYLQFKFNCIPLKKIVFLNLETLEAGDVDTLKKSWGSKISKEKSEMASWEAHNNKLLP